MEMKFRMSIYGPYVITLQNLGLQRVPANKKPLVQVQRIVFKQ